MAILAAKNDSYYFYINTEIYHIRIYPSKYIFKSTLRCIRLSFPAGISTVALMIQESGHCSWRSSNCPRSCASAVSRCSVSAASCKSHFAAPRAAASARDQPPRRALACSSRFETRRRSFWADEGPGAGWWAGPASL